MTQSATWNPDTFVNLTEFREVEEVLRRGKDFVITGTKIGNPTSSTTAPCSRQMAGNTSTGAAG
jgi:hypothetical protein